jgi:hypothetical protein
MMRQPRYLHAVILAGIALLLWAHPAEAQEWAQMVWTQAKALITMSILGFIFVQGGAILLFSQLLRLDGGIIATLLAMALGITLSVVAAIPTAVIAAMMPMFVSQLIISASTFACGGLAIKITFGTTFGLGILVYILASTVTLIFSCIAIILIF